MPRVEVNKPKKEFHIVSNGNCSLYFEKEYRLSKEGVLLPFWVLKKFWFTDKTKPVDVEKLPTVHKEQKKEGQ